MSEAKNHGNAKAAPAQKGPSELKAFFVNLITAILVVVLISYPPFTENLMAGFLLLLCLLLLNFGISYMTAVGLAIYVPSFVFAIYGFIASRSFITIGFFFAACLLVKGIIGMFRALSAGIGEKMEEANPTPPSMELWGKATEEIGKKAGEMIGKQGYVSSGGGKGVVRRVSKGNDELAGRFMELMHGNAPRHHEPAHKKPAAHHGEAHGEGHGGGNHKGEHGHEKSGHGSSHGH